MQAKNILRSGLLALGAVIALLPLCASAQQATPLDMQLGLIGLPEQSPVQIAEMKVTYHFDQIGTGKSTQAVPVQMTYRLHNPSTSQNLTVTIPTAGAEGQVPTLTAIFINGREEPLVTPSPNRFFGFGDNGTIVSQTVDVTVPKDADVIVDVRALQPLSGENLPFFFKTGRAWSGSIAQGNMEAIFPFTVANWNVVMRSQADSQPIPLAYSGKSASWSFNDLNLQTAQDVYWQMADLQAMSYYEQGLDRWRVNNNDPEAYAIMRRALLDMIPCHGAQMPFSSWWDNTYETVTVGLISSSGGTDEDQLIKALGYWSGGWTVPQGDEAECQAHELRSDRYRVALHEVLTMPQDQRSAAINQTLDKHYNFLRKLVAIKGNNSLQDDPQNIPSTDPSGDPKLSEADRLILANWDERFSTPSSAAANAQGNGESTLSSKTGLAASSSMFSQMLDKLPKLSFGTQVIIFALLALLVLIIIGYIIFKWQETPTVPPRPAMDQPAKMPTVPLMGIGLGNKVNLVQNPSVTSGDKHEPEELLAMHKDEKIDKPSLPTPPPVPPVPPKPNTPPPTPPKPWTPPPAPNSPPPVQPWNKQVNNTPFPPSAPKPPQTPPPQPPKNESGKEPPLTI